MKKIGIALQPICFCSKKEGSQLSRPYADTLYDPTLTHLKEMRIQSKGKLLRAFFAFALERQAIVLCVGDKSGDKRFYKKMIQIAELVYEIHLKQQK